MKLMNEKVKVSKAADIGSLPRCTKDAPTKQSKPVDYCNFRGNLYITSSACPSKCSFLKLKVRQLNTKGTMVFLRQVSRG